jgi:hypothetical protein
MHLLATLVSQWDEHYKYLWKYLYYFILLICGVFNDVSNLEYTVLNDWRSNELEMMWNETDVAYYEMMSWNFHGGTEEKHEVTQSG